MSDPSQLPHPTTTIVTGASGWLGTGLMGALSDPESPWCRGGEIRPFVRTRVEADALASLHGNVRPVVGDLRSDHDVGLLFAELHGDVDVIHTAGVIHPGSVDEFAEVNVGGTRRVLDAALTSGARRFVHISSNSPFGTNARPDDHFRHDEPYAPYYGYGRSKMEAELAVLDAVDRGLDAVIVRPPWFYGPHQPARQTTFFTMVKNGKFPILGDGGQAPVAASPPEAPALDEAALVQRIAQSVVRTIQNP